MNKYLFVLIIFIALFCVSRSLHGKELIVEFKGSESRTTAEFEVRAPWIADWRTTGDYPGQMAAQADLVSASSGEYIGKIFVTKYVDNGVRLFTEGGRYRFQVNSTLANWTLRVEQLTRQEAETYIPKEKLKY